MCFHTCSQPICLLAPQLSRQKPWIRGVSQPEAVIVDLSASEIVGSNQSPIISCKISIYYGMRLGSERMVGWYWYNLADMPHLCVKTVWLLFIPKTIFFKKYLVIYLPQGTHINWHIALPQSATANILDCQWSTLSYFEIVKMTFKFKFYSSWAIGR